MDLLLLPHSKSQEVAGRRLSTALRLESYFRSLVCENCAEEVHSQWNAARKLLTQELEGYAALKPRRVARTAG
jgi:hypothetical protein